MLEQGSPFSDSSASILVAAGPQDAQAIALVQDMRKAGLRVTFAETANIAARASEAAACVVLLRPDTWKAQAIATVMRAKPACLIPVLAEPMELPRGPWTHEAVSIGDVPEQGQQEVIQALRGYLATRPTPTPISRPNTGPLTLAPAYKFKKRRRFNARPFFTTLLILLIVGLGAALGYRYYTLHPTKSQPASTSITIPTTISYPSYSAKIPGQGCDTGSGQWNVGSHYKKDKNTEVIDKYTTLHCQTDGALITRSGDYSVYSEIFFDGRYTSVSLAQHYIVQVDATLISGDAHASFAMDTHIHNYGYGRYNFDLNTLGRWEVSVGSTVDGSPINRLAIGFAPKAAKTYTLALETDGPLMTFSINGTKVTTVTDTTYTDNDSIAFGVSDYSATTPISALFSNFQYKELAPSTLTAPQAVASATAQAQASLQTAYSAHVPGYGCDKGAGQWQPLADNDSSGKLQCLPNGMQLTAPVNTTDITSERFYGFNGRFPQNYQISAKIDVSAAYKGCAGMATHVDRNGQAYFFVVCPNGSWEVSMYTDKFHTLDQGTVNPRGTYQIKTLNQGSTLSLYIDGVKVSSIQNTQLKNTDHINLLVGYYLSNHAETATFSDFAFTPLP